MHRFGLIGFPLSHSFSPGYFAEKFKKEGITDCNYKSYPISKIYELDGLIKDDLVGLNVADHVPPDVSGKPLRFVDQFLHAVLAKVSLTCVVGCQEVFVGLGLADSHQLHLMAGILWMLVHLGLHGE